MKAIVSLNAGSSSIKFALYALTGNGPLALAASGKIEKIGIAPRLVARTSDGTVLLERDWPDGAAMTHADLLGALFAWSAAYPLEGREVIAVGHRVVHGGTAFAAPMRVDAALLDALEALCPLAPLHQPHNLAAIRAIAALDPALPQVACFDTGFHQGRPELATRLALPRALHDQGVRRYGFHGLSYEYVARRLAELDPALAAGRVIVAHLGNGASLCAMTGGRSVDTTMGFTALDGLMMGTRCGSIDPGVVLHLQTQLGMSAAAVEAMLYHDSGLLGVSGISSDMRTLAASRDPRAEEAIALFVWRAVREIGALAAVLGGLDGIVFTAGIGENDAEVRRRICAGIAWLGVTLDEGGNVAHAPRISRPDSRIAVHIIPTDEERMIALHTRAALEASA
ncbi:acetate/propionate family kinase [Sphingomonas azotifigens]|uniref:acetate/propionate family kinase n=1 Tax=Sphingomonas azotifigens TaxID=330920 RepID=UPI000A079C21|nr:acetate/propionate family kinase [Sphingomonas azotifigens]